MQLIKKTKKGFTLVELIVVIAIVAILAAVSVVSYIAFINSANESADIQLVKQLNTVLQGDEALNGTRTTPTEMLTLMDDNGFNVINLTQTKSGNDIVWDEANNRFALVNNFNKIYGEDSYDKDNKSKIWFFADTISEANSVSAERYAVCLTEKYMDDAKDLIVYSSVDTGNNDVVNLSYVNSTSTAQSIKIITNSPRTHLLVNAVNEYDDATHIGRVGDVLIKNIGTHCYYELGRVDSDINIKSGKIVMRENSSANSIIIDTTADDFDDSKQINIDNSESPQTPVVIRKHSSSTTPSNINVQVSEAVVTENTIIANDAVELISLANEGNKNIKLKQGTYIINEGHSFDGSEKLVINDYVKIIGEVDNNGRPLSIIQINEVADVTDIDHSRILLKGKDICFEGVKIYGVYPNQFYFSLMRLFGNNASFKNCDFENDRHESHSRLQFISGDIHHLEFINCNFNRFDQFMYSYGLYHADAPGALNLNILTRFINDNYEEKALVYFKNCEILSIAMYCFSVEGEGSFLVENSTVSTSWSSVGNLATLTMNNCEILYNELDDYCNVFKSYQMIILNNCHVANGIKFVVGDDPTSSGFTLNNTYYNNILITKDNFREVTPSGCSWDEICIVIINGERIQ